MVLEGSIGQESLWRRRDLREGEGGRERANSVAIVGAGGGEERREEEGRR